MQTKIEIKTKIKEPVYEDHVLLKGVRITKIAAEIYQIIAHYPGSTIDEIAVLYNLNDLKTLEIALELLKNNLVRIYKYDGLRYKIV